MKIAMNNTLSVDDILLAYSGRRLQYAIRMGILPAPEALSRLLSKNARGKNKSSNAHRISKANLALEITSKAFSKVRTLRAMENLGKTI